MGFEGKHRAAGRFVGKVVLVTGGTRHIGLGIACGFAAEGADVAVLGRDVASGNHAVATLRAAGARALFVAADVQREAEVRAAVDATEQAFGGLHVLVNNAGLISHATHDARIADITTEHWQDYLDANVTGPFNCSRLAIPAMLRAGGGAIVNVNSTAAEFARPRAAGYGVSKSALRALTRYTAVDYGPQIRCNEVIVGPIRRDEPSPLYELLDNDEAFAGRMRERIASGRLGRPDDVAHACMFLAEDASSFITGASLAVDGGSHLTTPLLDWASVSNPGMRPPAR
jgi:NAD(P)-dependent dehydrogenase (short-subunit alcohol dehydrogenase family)